MARNTADGGTDNVLADLDFPDAEELAAKTILAKKVNEILDARGLTGAEAATVLSMPEPKIAAVRNYRLRGISLHRLMRSLTALGKHVEIFVSPTVNKADARIDVAA